MQRALHAVPEQSVDDATLLARMQDGDDAAFATLVRRHTTRFYRVAYRFMNHPTEAEDVVQDAFIKLWEKPDSWRTDGGSAFTTWFYRVVVNLCLDRKKNKQTLPLSEDLPVPDLRPTQEENMIERQQEKQLETHIALLPERQRTALNLCFYEGLSNQEAATIMGVRLKALQSLLMRAKMTLKLKLIDAKGA